jgi:tetratricopeptide (TPR) repeat protein
MFGGGPVLGPHADVLSAEPEDEKSKQNLLDELKRRAKASLGCKNYPEAIQLYSKGLELFPSDAILYANRSMCHLNMKKYDLALNDGAKATELDMNYAKGYYRKASAHIALNEYKSAHDALEKGLVLGMFDTSIYASIDSVNINFTLMVYICIGLILSPI